MTLKLSGLIAYIYYVLEKIVIESPTITDDIIITSLPKTMAKNALFIELEQLCQTLWAFLSNFGSFDDTRSPNMVMSHDPRCTSRKSFVLILHLMSGKSQNFQWKSYLF